MGRKGTFTKALKHLKSTEIDERIQKLEESPTNNTMGYMTATPTTPNPDYKGPEHDQNSALQVLGPDFDADGQDDGKDTSGLFQENADGTVTIRTALPPITGASPDRSYILGPMASMYYTWSYPWTMIGYVRQEDRKFVNLARISGKLSDWDGVSNFNATSWGGQLTLEQAVWYRDVAKKDGVNNDPANANYRAFYPGPPSNSPDAFGRYYCTITGEHVRGPLDGVGEDPNNPGTGGPGTPEDIFSAIMDRKRRGEKLSKAEEDWLKENLPPLNSMKGNRMNTDAYNMPEDEFEKKYGIPPDQVRDYYGYGDWAGDSPPDANSGFADRAELLDYANTLRNALDKQARGGTLTPKELYALNSSGVAGADHTLLKGMLAAVKAGKIINLIDSLGKWWNKGKKFGKGGEEQWDWKKLLDDDWSKRQQSKLGKGDWDILRLAKFWKEGSLGSGPTPAAREFFRRFGPIGNELYNKIWGQKLPPSGGDDRASIGIPGGTGDDRVSIGVPGGSKGVERVHQELGSLADAGKEANSILDKMEKGLENDISPEDFDDLFKQWKQKIEQRNRNQPKGIPIDPEFIKQLLGGGKEGDKMYAGGSKDFDERTGKYRSGKKSVGSLPGSKGPKGDKMYAGGSKDFDERTGKYTGGDVKIAAEYGKGSAAKRQLQKDIETYTGHKTGDPLHNPIPGANYGKDRQFTGPGSLPINLVKGDGKSKSVKKSKSKSTRVAHYEPEGKVLSESARRQLREIKKPVEIKEEEPKKLKGYRPKFKRKDETVGVTPHIAKPVKTPQQFKSVGSPNAWGQYEYNKNVLKSQERMNQVYELVGDGHVAFDYMLTDSKKLNAEQMEKFWGLHPDLYSYFYDGKKYKAIRKEQLKGDYLLFLVDENGEKSNILQSELNEKLGEEQEKKELAEYNAMYKKKEPTPVYQRDPLFKKVAKRLKSEIDYPKKPAKKGYPDEPPPKQINGWHPEYGQRYKYDKLDPQSAEAMPQQGNPEIDANIEKSTDQKKKARKFNILVGRARG